MSQSHFQHHHQFQNLESRLEKDLEVQKSKKLRTVRSLVFASVFAVLLVAVVLLSSTSTDNKDGTPYRSTHSTKSTHEETSTSPSSSSSSGWSRKQSKNKDNVRQQASTTYTTSNTVVDFTMRRVGYSALDYFDPDYTSHLKYTFLQNYTAVIEPSVAMEFHLYDTTPIYSGGLVFEFIICPNNQDSSSSSSCQSGQYYYDNSTKALMSDSVTYTGCTPHSDTYTITVFTVNSEGHVMNQYSAQAMCMYVRREIRSLSSADLDAYLDASFQLYNLSTEEGVALYGDNFMSNHKLVKLHYFNAGQRDADHLHEGNGFYAQHVKLTNIFEASVQLVDSSVSVPYWDFTIDHASGSKAFDSYVASSDVFGSISYPVGDSKAFTRPDNSVVDAMIPDGRWAGLLAESEDADSMSSAYGYLRAPWCLNPSPYVSRFAFDWDVSIGYLPSCKSHYLILEYTDMMDYFYEISLDPHGTAHTAIGGIYGCDALDSLSEMGVFTSNTTQYQACAEMANVIKESYRFGYINIPNNCEVNFTDPGNSNCTYTCASELKGFQAAEFMYARVNAYVNSTAYGKKGFLKLFKDFICDGSISLIYAGDHYESSAMSDPSFWVMHPTIERLTHAKFMSGGFETETWANSTDDDFICTKQTCFDETINETSNFTTCCYGHYETDRMYNGILSSRDEYFGPTNGEIISSSDPRSTNYTVNYIYDGFTWEHCGSDYSLSTLLGDLKTHYDLVKTGKKVKSARSPSDHELRTRAKLEKIVREAKIKLEKIEEEKELMLLEKEDQIIEALMKDDDNEEQEDQQSRSVIGHNSR